MPTRRTVALALSMGLAALLAACSSGGGITVKDAYVLITTPSVPAAAYMTITNNGGSDDVLTSVSSPAFGSAELHQTVTVTAPPAASMAPMSMAPMSMAPMSMSPMSTPASSMAAMASGEPMVGMQSVSEITVPAHGSITLAPGGYHVMLMDPTAAYSVGQQVQITLTFKNAGTVTVNAEVRGA